ncbi:interleukin-20 receptor subunit beta [Gopherus evgoodei]|uniref:interleukin-20 receptor subunit beta n=1 Tax=Gopherus evgoodei TaxID=1825980 RepID=UPI0011CF5724|nr:interleukin-20 receptor subunit beta [Gopherus evgoodei]
MKHFLTWSPVTVPGETVRYSVEFQGEYERDYANETWIPISECSLIIVTQCNVTEDISATVAYNLRVRANLGSRGSEWSTLKVLFNRITTFLTPPMMEVSVDGYHLLVKLEDLGPAFQFHIFYWRKGQESWVHKKTVKEISSAVHLDTMEAGAEYCVKARTYVEAINRSSNFSQMQCVRGPDGGRSIWMTTAMVSFVGFVVGVLALPFFAWKMSQIFQYSCCPVVVLPDTLKVTESPMKLIHCMSEGTEYCDMAVHVIPPKEILRLWIQDAL